MARYDIDGSPTTYHPTLIDWDDPVIERAHDGSATWSNYRFPVLVFYEGELILPAAFEEWISFCDGTPHSIVLPPADDVLGGDVLYTGVYITPHEWPDFVYHLARGFAVQVGPLLMT